MNLWRRLFHSRTLDRELDAELRDHVERQVADGVRAGRSEAEVRRQIRLSFGGLDQVKEECRDVRVPPVLAGVAADLRFATRLLIKDRWFAAGAVLALGLAMALANTAFMLALSTELRGLPVERPDRIAIMSTQNAQGVVIGGVSYPDFEDWRRDVRVFDTMAAFSPSTVSLGGDGAVPEQFNSLYVSASTFGVLGVRPAVGRDFSATDDRPGAEAVVIIGDSVWKNRYGASPDVVGRLICVNGTVPATIIGVMPNGFRFHEWIDVWLPISQMPAATRQRRDARSLFVLGRLPDGVGLDRVRVELSTIAASLAMKYPDTNKDIRPGVDWLAVAFNGTATMALRLMPLLAAVFILLIACANLANLLLARAAYRSREIAIRVSLGATRWRIARQLLVESLVLSLVATVLALGLSWIAVQPFSLQLQKLVPYVRLTVDGRLLVLLGGVALVTTGLFGLAPALYAARRGTADGLKEGGRAGVGPKTRFWTNGLLVGQFALTLVLLTAAGLSAKGFYALRGLDVQVDTSDWITAVIRLPPQKYATPDQRIAFHAQLRDRLAAAPGITASTITTAPPFVFAAGRGLTSVDGRPVEDPAPNVMTAAVEPGYFRALGLTLVIGESFSDRHGSPGDEAAIVNRRFVEKYLGSGNPIGRRIGLQSPRQQPASAVPLTIVGVSPDIRQGQGDAGPMVYVPYRAAAPAGVTLMVRGSGGPARVMSAARDAAYAIDHDLALGIMRPLDELRDNARLPSTMLTSQFTAFAIVALVLAAVGLYSVMAYAVTRRTQEIALRMALGARPADIGWLFLRTSAWVIAGGLLVGVPLSVAAGRLHEANFVYTDASDPATLLVVVGVLVAVALAAALVPVRRAARVEPTVALRVE